MPFVRSNFKSVLSLLLTSGLLCLGCGFVDRYYQQKSERATWVAEQYPWAVYPITEESKSALCQALDLPPDDDFCEPRKEIRHEAVLNKIREVFPEGRTTYPEVERLLGHYPHLVEESLHPDGTIVSRRYVYGLTEYEGACISFYISLDGREIVDRIGASGLGSGPSPTTCGPFR
jgi:hypothetical protein